MVDYHSIPLRSVPLNEVPILQAFIKSLVDGKTPDVDLTTALQMFNANARKVIELSSSKSTKAPSSDVSLQTTEQRRLMMVEYR